MDNETTKRLTQLQQELDKLEEEKTVLIHKQRYEKAALWRNKARVVRDEMKKLKGK